MATFLGQPLTASFPVVPSRSLVDLLVDPVLNIASVCLLPSIFRAIRTPANPNTTTSTDLICFWILVFNRVLTCVDTLFVLFFDNSASSFLIYFSLTRSLLRYSLHLIALAHVMRRRLVAASGAVLGKYTALCSLMTLGMVIAAMVGAMVILVSFFYAGVASKAAGDSFLAANPRATVAQLRRVLNDATPMWPSQLWQLHLAIGLPLVHVVDVVLNCFFYSVASHIWSQTFLSVRKLTAARWMALSWPLILSIVLHINFLLLTLLQRTALRSWSLGYVVELGQLTTVLDWFTFFTQTLPMMDGLTVAKVTLPATSKTADSSSPADAQLSKAVTDKEEKRKEARGRSRSRSRSRSRPKTMTMYTKSYAPPTVALSHIGGNNSPDRSARSSYLDITSHTDHVNQSANMPMAPLPTSSRFVTSGQAPPSSRPAVCRDHLTIDTHCAHRPRRPSRPRNDHLTPSPLSPATYSNVGTELSQQARDALPPTSCSHLAIPADLYSPPASPTMGQAHSSDYARYHASGASRVRRRSRTGLEGEVRGRDDRTTIVVDDPGHMGGLGEYNAVGPSRLRSGSATRHHLPMASQYPQQRPSGDNGHIAGHDGGRRHQMTLPPLSPVVEQRTSPVSASAPAPPRRAYGGYGEPLLQQQQQQQQSERWGRVR